MDYRNFCDSLTPDDIYERELFTSVQALILSVKVLPLIWTRPVLSLKVIFWVGFSEKTARGFVRLHEKRT